MALDATSSLSQYLHRNKWYQSALPTLHDVWSVGCIFAEVIVHEPFFRRVNPQHQLQVIVSKLGMPSKEKLRCVDSKEGLKEISCIEAHRPPAFSTWFSPNTNPLALPAGPARQDAALQPGYTVSAAYKPENPQHANWIEKMNQKCSSLRPSTNQVPDATFGIPFSAEVYEMQLGVHTAAVLEFVDRQKAVHDAAE